MHLPGLTASEHQAGSVILAFVAGLPEGAVRIQRGRATLAGAATGITITEAATAIRATPAVITTAPAGIVTPTEAPVAASLAIPAITALPGLAILPARTVAKTAAILAFTVTARFPFTAITAESAGLVVPIPVPAATITPVLPGTAAFTTITVEGTTLTLSALAAFTARCIPAAAFAPIVVPRTLAPAFAITAFRAEAACAAQIGRASCRERV